MASLVQSSTRLTRIDIKDCGLREEDTTSELYFRDQDADGEVSLYIDLTRPNKHKPWAPPCEGRRLVQKQVNALKNDEGYIIS